jgi:hypothetical protein
MTITVRILGSRAREQVPGTSITLHAPGFRGALTQLKPGMAHRAGFDLPFADAAASTEVMLAAQLDLQLEAHPGPRVPGLRSRSATVTHPRVIVPRRHGVAYALLQTDESGVSDFLSPQPGDDTEAVFVLPVSARGATRRTLRVLMWPDLQASASASLTIITRWEQSRRPHQLAQYGVAGTWQAPDWSLLAAGAVLLLLHDTFSTSQATFSGWMHSDSFTALARHYQGRCLAFTHPTLSAGIGDNLGWLLANLSPLPGPFDVVAHGRGGLLARALAVDGRLPLRRVCQVGTPNKGTTLACEAHLPQFLDGHVAMLATVPGAAAQGTLEGALCLARCVAQGMRAALPGLDALTPDAMPRHVPADHPRSAPAWFTVGGQFAIPDGHAQLARAGNLRAFDDFHATPNDLVVPSRGCHEPGFRVEDSLHLHQVHHHGYFADEIVRRQLRSWLL